MHPTDILLVAGDIYRPAAIKQLQVVGEKAGAPVFEKGTQDPVATAQEAVRHARDYGNDYVIIDTAGRLQIDEALMEELRQVAVEALDRCEHRRSRDWSTIKSEIKGSLSNYLYKKTKRNPMILPVIMEV